MVTAAIDKLKKKWQKSQKKKERKKNQTASGYIFQQWLSKRMWIDK